MSGSALVRGNRDVAMGGAVLVGITLVVVLIFSGVVTKLLSQEDRRTVRATFADAQQVRVGTDVRIDGIDVGKVQQIQLGPSGRSATITMEIDREAGALRSDASAVLRFKTLLGGTFYVDLERGSPTRAELGEQTIPLSRTGRQVELDDITPVVGGAARRGLRTLPRELAAALRDSAVPDRLLRTAAAAAPGIERGVGALRGRQKDRELAELVRGSARVVGALHAPRGEIRDLVQGAAATVRTTAGRGSELRTLLRVSPPAGREVDATLTRLRTTLDLIDPLVGELQAAAGDVAPTFARLRPVVVGARSVLRRADPLLGQLRPAARSLALTARQGAPLLDELTPSVERTDRTILPMLSEVDAGTQKSTAVMIGGTFAALGAGAGGQMDTNGHFIRFPATTGSSPVNSLPCQLYLLNPDVAQVAACNTLSDALKAVLSYNPLGDVPGTADGPETRGKR